MMRWFHAIDIHTGHKVRLETVKQKVRKGYNDFVYNKLAMGKRSLDGPRMLRGEYYCTALDSSTTFVFVPAELGNDGVQRANAYCGEYAVNVEQTFEADLSSFIARRHSKESNTPCSTAPRKTARTQTGYPDAPRHAPTAQLAPQKHVDGPYLLESARGDPSSTLRPGQGAPQSASVAGDSLPPLASEQGPALTGVDAHEPPVAVPAPHTSIAPQTPTIPLEEDMMDLCAKYDLEEVDFYSQQAHIGSQSDVVRPVTVVANTLPGDQSLYAIATAAKRDASNKTPRDAETRTIVVASRVCSPLLLHAAVGVVQIASHKQSVDSTATSQTAPHKQSFDSTAKSFNRRSDYQRRQEVRRESHARPTCSVVVEANPRAEPVAPEQPPEKRPDSIVDILMTLLALAQSDATDKHEHMQIISRLVQQTTFDAPPFVKNEQKLVAFAKSKLGFCASVFSTRLHVTPAHLKSLVFAEPHSLQDLKLHQCRRRVDDADTIDLYLCPSCCDALTEEQHVAHIA